MKNPKVILGGTIVILIGIGIAIFFGKRKAKRKWEAIEKIKNIIEAGVGASGKDISSLLLDVIPDPVYNATKDVDTLLKAPGIFKDDNDAVFKVLSGKTIRQLAKINQQMKNSTAGKSLDEFLQGIFKELVDCSPDLNLKCTYPNYKRALTIVETAASKEKSKKA